MGTWEIPSDDDKESGSKEVGNTLRKPRMRLRGSQRGHSTLRAGKPSHMGEGPQLIGCLKVRSLPLYTGESRLGGRKETRVNVLIGGRRVR